MRESVNPNWGCQALRGPLKGNALVSPFNRSRCWTSEVASSRGFLSKTATMDKKLISSFSLSLCLPQDLVSRGADIRTILRDFSTPADRVGRSIGFPFAFVQWFSGQCQANSLWANASAYEPVSFSRLRGHSQMTSVERGREGVGQYLTKGGEVAWI